MTSYKVHCKTQIK